MTTAGRNSTRPPNKTPGLTPTSLTGRNASGNDLTQERVKHLFGYDPETGILSQNHATRYKATGSPVGSLNTSGHLQTHLKGMSQSHYLVHRLIWLWLYGEFPQGEVDHINHNKTDNRQVNLRDVSYIENRRNLSKPANNTSGAIGVHWRAERNKWLAYIYINKKRIYLGLYEDFDAAVAARKAADIKYGFHPNHGEAA